MIEPGGKGVKRSQDRQAMGTLLRSVPQEMWQMLGAKKTVKEAWAGVKSMHVGAERVKEANAQRLLREFENIVFKDGETVDEFAMRINALAADLRTSGESVEEIRVVKKMLRVLPQRYTQIVISIETLLDLKSLTIEDLVGRLKMAEDRFGVVAITDKASKLLLTEEDWAARNRHCLLPESSSSTGSERRSGKPKGGGGVGRGDHGEKKEHAPRSTYEGTPRRKGRCRNCGIYGHWKEDCKQPPRKERKEEAHHVQADTEHAALLLATVNTMHVRLRDVESLERCMTRQVVHLNEKKVHPGDCDEDRDV
ncbi:uncharacterized protein [Miscanthus floridulus]|uniref:uncharacterized protein n=1 Tax=Miscanthus floridulus TaxID=154761 RepID=UPI00345A0FC8